MVVGLWALSSAPTTRARPLSGRRPEPAAPGHSLTVAADRVVEPPAEIDGIDADTGGSLSHAPAQILSRTEMVSLAKKESLDLESLMISGETVREQAVRERDLVRASCVEEHLLQMKIVKSVANDAVAALRRPDVQNDELRLRHEFRRLEMGKEQLTQHLLEMQECAGAETPIDDGLAEIGGQKPMGPAEADPTAVNVTTPPAERPVAASPIF